MDNGFSLEAGYFVVKGLLRSELAALCQSLLGEIALIIE